MGQSFSSVIHARRTLGFSCVVAGVLAIATFSSSAQAQRYLVTNLGTLGGTVSVGRAINAGGQVIGYGNTTGNAAQHAFVYSHGRMLDLNTLLTDDAASLYTLTAGIAINNRGQILAQGYVNATGQNAVFLLTRHYRRNRRDRDARGQG